MENLSSEQLFLYSFIRSYMDCIAVIMVFSIGYLIYKWDMEGKSFKFINHKIPIMMIAIYIISYILIPGGDALLLILSRN